MPASATMKDDRVILKDAYLVEFPSDSGDKDHFQTIIKSLKASHGIPKSAIKLRHLIRSSLFSGVSFSLTASHSVEAIEMIEGIIAIYPIYIIPAPRPSSIPTKASVPYDNATDSFNSHDLTGITQVHQQLQNFGAGVRVRKPQISSLLYIHQYFEATYMIYAALEIF